MASSQPLEKSLLYVAAVASAFPTSVIAESTSSQLFADSGRMWHVARCRLCFVGLEPAQNSSKSGKFGEFWQNLRAEVAAAFLLLFFLQGIWAIIVTNSYGDPNTTAVDHSDLSFWLQGLLHNTPELQGYYLSSLILNGSYEPL